MLEKTRGIVLHSIPYNDNYSIIYMYTERFGRVSYMVSSAKRKRTKFPRALFMPFSVLDMDVEHSLKRDIQKVKDVRSCFLQNEIRCNPVKSALAMFLSEILFRVIRDSEPDDRLFHFLYDSILLLEQIDAGVANYHLVFLFRLLHYLGIYPNTETHSDQIYFDMRNGVFTRLLPLHTDFLDERETIVFVRMLKMSYENMALFSFSRKERVRIIERIIEYYRLHLPEFPEIRSLAVLQSIFD